MMDAGSNNSNNNNGVKVRVKAALGTSWHHCVSTRIMMEVPHDQEQSLNDSKNHAKQVTHYRDMGYHYQMDNSGMARVATIVKSNLVGKHSLAYQVTGSGVIDVATPLARNDSAFVDS
jgi:hypothetical protein